MNKIITKSIIILLCAYVVGFGLGVVSSIPITMFVKHSLSLDIPSIVLSSLPVANLFGIVVMLFVILLFSITFVLADANKRIKK